MITAKNTFPSILPIWQEIGSSTYQITNFVAKKYGVKATHTGVLDPMAEGVVIVLLGNERFKKMEHTAWLKEYEFDILFGIATDTHDGLGLITDRNFDLDITKESLEKTLKTFVGEYSQKAPVYSARKVAGKKLFTYPKSGKDTPELPTMSGKIHEIKLLAFERQRLNSNIDTIISNIQKVKTGDFRQKEIINQWKALRSDRIVTVAKIKVIITRGMYIRSLCNDINRTSFITKLVRTKNGPYSKDECTRIYLEHGASTMTGMLH